MRAPARGGGTTLGRVAGVRPAGPRSPAADAPGLLNLALLAAALLGGGLPADVPGAALAGAVLARGTPAFATDGAGFAPAPVEAALLLGAPRALRGLLFGMGVPTALAGPALVGAPAEDAAGTVAAPDLAGDRGLVAPPAFDGSSPIFSRPVVPAGRGVPAAAGELATGELAGGGGVRLAALAGSESSGSASSVATEFSVTALLTSMRCPHLRHFMRTDRPATLSSATWYFALQLGQRNFIQLSAGNDAQERGRRATNIAWRALEGDG